MTIFRLIISAALSLWLSACASPGQSGVGLDPSETSGDVVPSSTETGPGPDMGAGLPDTTDESESSRFPDRDGDQIADADDRCPDSDPDAAIDAQGCAVFGGVIENLAFAPDDDELNDAAIAALDALIADLNAYPDAVIAVDGHTDNRGLASNNLDLSKRRVIAVVRYLVEQGIPASRLKPYGYGESRPLKSNATPEGRRSNRRIEVRQVGA